MLLSITYAKKPPSNTHQTVVTKEARGLISGMRLPLLSYFMIARSNCTGNTARIRRVRLITRCLSMWLWLCMTRSLRLKIKCNDWLLASNQSLRFILSLRLYSSFITSRPGQPMHLFSLIRVFTVGMKKIA